MSNNVSLASSVIEVLKLYRDTVFAKDTEAHLTLYDENALLFDAWDKWSLQGFNDLQGMITEWFDSLGTDRVVVEMGLGKSSTNIHRVQLTLRRSKFHSVIRAIESESMDKIRSC